jgi:hypothetical protein
MLTIKKEMFDCFITITETTLLTPNLVPLS